MKEFQNNTFFFNMSLERIIITQTRLPYVSASNIFSCPNRSLTVKKPDVVGVANGSSARRCWGPCGWDSLGFPFAYHLWLMSACSSSRHHIHIQSKKRRKVPPETHPLTESKIIFGICPGLSLPFHWLELCKLAKTIRTGLSRVTQLAASSCKGNWKKRMLTSLSSFFGDKLEGSGNEGLLV